MGLFSLLKGGIFMKIENIDFVRDYFGDLQVESALEGYIYYHNNKKK